MARTRYTIVTSTGTTGKRNKGKFFYTLLSGNGQTMLGPSQPIDNRSVRDRIVAGMVESFKDGTVKVVERPLGKTRQVKGVKVKGVNVTVSNNLVRQPDGSVVSAGRTVSVE